jgi:hypothetical protein
VYLSGGGAGVGGGYDSDYLDYHAGLSYLAAGGETVVVEVDRNLGNNDYDVENWFEARVDILPPGYRDPGADRREDVTAVSPEGGTEGEFEWHGDTDWYAFDLVGGRKYIVKLGHRPDVAHVEVIGPDGAALGSSREAWYDNSVHFVAPADGRYYVAAVGRWIASGYAFTMRGLVDDHPDVPAGATVLKAGKAGRGMIEKPDDGDAFRFVVRARRWYLLDLTNRAAADFPEDEPGGADGLTVLRLGGGRYGIFSTRKRGVTARVTAPGLVPAAERPYRITLNVPEDDHPDGPGPAVRSITPPRSVRGRIETPVDADVFSLRLGSALTFSFLRVNRSGAAPHLRIDVLSADGKTVVVDGVEVPGWGLTRRVRLKAGDYLVRVSAASRASMDVSYQIELRAAVK